MSRKTTQNMHKGIAFLLSFVLLFSIMVPAGIGAEQLPYSDLPSVSEEVYDSDPPSVQEEVYDADPLPPVEEEFELQILSETDSEYWIDYAATSFVGGTGAVGDPYQIADGSQLAYLTQLVNSGAQDSVSGKVYAEEAYVLTENIDLSSYPWVPIGQNTDGLKFTGSFDGNNKNVGGLNIEEETTDYIGLFGVIGAGGSVKDLTLAGAEITGKSRVGVVAGKLEAAEVKGVTLANCSVKATDNKLANGSYAGGLAGLAEGSFRIEGCAVSASAVEGVYYTGGILGAAAEGNGVISFCTVFGLQVKGTQFLGGICGQLKGAAAEQPEIYRCSFAGAGSSVAGGSRAGGIVGSCNSYRDPEKNAVRECYVDTAISGTGPIGGIIGYCNPTNKEAAIVLNCCSRGSVKSTSSSAYVAGIIGQSANGGIISNCYSTAELGEKGTLSGIGGDIYKVNGCVALNPSATTDSSARTVGRIFAAAQAGFATANNYAFQEMRVSKAGKLYYVPWSTRTGALNDGEDVSNAQLSGGFFAGLGWDSAVWQMSAGKLPTLKDLPASITQPDDLPAYLSGSVDWMVKAFAPLATTEKEVHFTTAPEDIVLPAQLEATLKAGEQAAVIPVTWSSVDYTNQPGSYTFTSVLPPDCSPEAGVALPQITVRAANQALQSKNPVPTQYVTGSGAKSFAGGDVAEDADGDPLTITEIVTAPDAGIATAALDSGTGTVTITRVAPGTATVIVKVSDGAASLDVTVPITVYNHEPEAKDPMPVQSITDAGAGSAVSFGGDGIAIDIDGDALRITAIVTPPEASVATAALDSATGTVTVTGVAPGATTMVVTVSDGLDAVEVTVPITVSGNRTPAAKDPVPFQTISGTGSKSFAAGDIAQDADGDALRITAIVTPPEASVATAALDSTTGTVTVTGAGSASGTTAITVRVSDGAATADVTVPIIVSAGSWADHAAAAFAGGTGTAGDPYRIADGSQLAYLAQLVNSGTVDTVNDEAGKTYAQKAYVLTQSIDLSGHLWKAIGQNAADKKFTGSFNGGNQSVSGLHVSETTDYQGLFGVVGTGGSVKNLTLSGATVGGKRYVGAVAGRIEAAVIENLHLANSSVTASSGYAGGLAGYGEGIFAIDSCTVSDSAVVTATSNCGGILGYASNASGFGVISSCVVSASRIEATGNYAGGICAYMQGNSSQKVGAEISRCAFGGSVKANRYAGGIAGWCASYKENAIRECYADAEIFAANYNAGGIAGYVASPDIVLLDCYSRGVVNAPTSNYAAGISASGGTVQNCYSTAAINAKDHLAAGVAVYAHIQTSAALNPSITMAEAASDYEFGRVMSKNPSESYTVTQNLAFKEMRISIGGKLHYIPAADRMGNLLDGKDVSYAELAGTASPFYTAPLNWDGGVWNLAAGKLPTLKNLPAPVVQSDALPDYLSGSIDWTVKAFVALPGSVEVDNGTARENIGLPAQLEVTLASGNQAAVIPVTWSPSPDYDATPGVYTFTAALPGDCPLKTGVALPEITVTVKDNCAVTFDSRSGSAIEPLSDIVKGSLISAPIAPTRTGFIFGGWFKDAACTQEWNFAADTVTESITLYAKWTVDGASGYVAPQTGIQHVDVSGKGFNNSTIVTVAHTDGFVTYAVVAEQRIDFWGPAGAYVIANSGMSIGPKIISAFDQNAGNTPQEKSYKGTGTAEDPYAMLGGFYTKDGSALSTAPSIGATFRIWNLIAGYDQDGKIDLGTPYSILLENRNMTTGRLIASFFVDGSEFLPSNAEGWFRSPGTYGVVLNPSDQIIAGSFSDHALYKADKYPDRLADATTALQAVRADSKKVLMYHTQTRDFPGPVTHKLDVSGYFNEGDTVHINYLLGAANKGLYHGVSLDEDYMLAMEPIYIKNNTSAVVTDGYISFNLYNGGYFELVKAEDDNQETKYVAEFAVNGGGDKLYPGTIHPQILAAGSAVTKPDDPVKEGYTFGGWYTDEDCTSPFDFEEPLTQHVILYAKWTEEGGGDPDDPGNPGGGTVPSYTVTFETGEDPDSGDPNATIAAQKVKSGKTARDPGFFDSGYGYLVLAWYTDSKLKNEYDFGNEVTADLTLYPKWMRYILKDDLKKDGGSGTENSPYRAHLANSRQSKIAWKALNEISGHSEWWKAYVTEDNERNGTVRYAWVFNGKDIDTCNNAHPYYTDIALSKKSSDTVQAKFVWRTAIEGKVYVSINVSDYFAEGADAEISYVNGSCDGKVAHTDVESGEWVDSLHHPSDYYSGGTSKVEDGFVTLELTHGGTYLIKSTGVSTGGTGGSGPTSAPEEEKISVYLTPEGEAKDGAAIVAVTDTEIDGAIDSAVEEEADEIVIAPRITGEAKNIRVELSKTSVQNMAGKTGAALTFKTDLAAVTIAHDALAELAGKNGDRVIFIIEKISEDTVKFEIRLNVQVLENLNIKLAIPVDEAGDGMVAVLVKADGSEETIRKSLLDGDQLLALVGGAATVKIMDKSRSFQDVDDSFWGKKAVDFAASHELFAGVSEREFGPNGAMTRGMLVTVLHRLENTPGGENVTFADVDKESWYAQAVAWAGGNSLVSGTEKGFEPEGKITREQLAAMLYRYAQYVGLDTDLQGDIAQFGDAGQISDWAGDAMSWTVGAGLMTGKGDDILDPKGQTTRAEVAAVAYRLIQKMVR